MNSEELKQIIINEPKCYIIDNCRTAFFSSGLPSEINNNKLNELFPEYLNQKYFIDIIFQIINKKYFEKIDDLKKYLKLLEINSKRVFKECLYKNENEEIYFQVVNDFWEKYSIVPTKEPIGEFVVPLSKINTFQNFFLNQKVYNTPLLMLDNNEEKILRKNNLIVDLYEYEI